MKMNKGMLLALTPVSLWAVYLFGSDAFFLILVSAVSAVGAEALFQKAVSRPIKVKDLSSLITGVLLALTVSPSVPLHAIAIGSAIAVIVGKELFGGYNKNIFNPALFGRLVMAAIFPGSLTPWVRPFDMVSTATPLTLLREDQFRESLVDLFVGRIPGSMGEVSFLLIAVGAAYLIYRRFIDYRTPLSILATVVVFSFLTLSNPFVHIFSGGLMLGACFMATDPATSPRSKQGRIVFGIGIGVIVMVMRTWSWLPEGVTFAILGMNAAVPLINERTRNLRLHRPESVQTRA